MHQKKTKFNVSDLQRAQPGPLLVTGRRLRNMPQVWKLGIPFSLCAVGVIGAMAWSSLRQPEATEVSTEISDFNIVSDDPRLVAGVTPEDPPEVALEKMLVTMPLFDEWVQTRIAADLDFPIAKESARLIEYARKEANGGEIELSDPLGKLDLKACQTRLEVYECVLLRYAGDGIKQYQEGSQADDVEEMVAGAIRYYAALKALFPLAMTRQDAGPTLGGMANYRDAIYLMQQWRPEAIAPMNQVNIAPDESVGEAAQGEDFAQ